MVGAPADAQPHPKRPIHGTFGDDTLDGLLVDRPLTDNLHPDGQLIMQLSEIFLGEKLDVMPI